MKANWIVIAFAAASLFAGCRQTEQPTTAPDTVIMQEPMPQAEVILEEAEPVAKPTRAKAKPTGAKSEANKKAETIYVETDGAQGRVWGHVTMKGDRGTGTIHDWDENTLTVSVTRHGNELFAVDQNSRQYVFKLKK